MTLHELATPALVLDVDRVRRNAARMRDRARALGVRLRPHVKTHKCVEVARIQTEGFDGAITVSTLAEGIAFAEHGFRDITYAVPIEPGKFDRALELRRRCERLAVITDDSSIPELLDRAATAAGLSIDVFVKVDSGYHRCGVDPESVDAIAIPQSLDRAASLRFAGILTHAGHSYSASSWEGVASVAREERDTMVRLAERIRDDGIDVPTVSVGSTPTMCAVDHLEGVDEMRPGNYIFFDEFQSSLGSCAPSDCALSVLAAVVHRDPKRQSVVVDAGGIALSKDAGAGNGFGRVVSADGEDLDIRVRSISQEHGKIDVDDSSMFDRLSVGSRVRIVTNHSCMTSAQFTSYNVLDGGALLSEQWALHRGW